MQKHVSRVKHNTDFLVRSLLGGGDTFGVVGTLLSDIKLIQEHGHVLEYRMPHPQQDELHVPLLLVVRPCDRNRYVDVRGGACNAFNWHSDMRHLVSWCRSHGCRYPRWCSSTIAAVNPVSRTNWCSRVPLKWAIIPPICLSHTMDLKWK